MQHRHVKVGEPADTTCRGFITELVQRCARRDEEALGRLVDLLQPLVLAAAQHRFPHRPADDVAVEVFVRVWQLAPSFDGGQIGPVTWILSQLAEVPEPRFRAVAGERA